MALFNKGLPIISPSCVIIIVAIPPEPDYGSVALGTIYVRIVFVEKNSPSHLEDEIEQTDAIG